MKNNDPILNFLKLQGYTGEQLKIAYDKLKKENITLNQLITRFVKKVDDNPNSLSCHKCTDRSFQK
jgi:hypothetical protein